MNSLKLNPTKNNFETKIFWLNANVKKFTINLQWIVIHISFDF